MKLKTKKRKNASRFKLHVSSFTFQASGFTLLETLVALSVLTFGIVGPVTLAIYSIRSASFSKNQITAFYLAQEAMEYVRNHRDTNALQDAAEWLDGLGSCRGATKGCYIDVTTNQIKNCPNDGCPKIKYNSANGIYNYSIGAETSFIREIKLKDVQDYEAKITVALSWQDKGISKSFTFEENFLDWP